MVGLFAYDKLTRAEMVAVYNAVCDKSIMAFRTSGIGADRLRRETAGRDPDAIIGVVATLVGTEISEKLSGLIDPDARKNYKSLLKEEAAAERDGKTKAAVKKDKVVVAAAVNSSAEVATSANGSAAPRKRAARTNGADTRVITVKETRTNLFRPGTGRAQRWAALATGMTVSDWYAKAGAGPNNLRRLIELGFISVA